MIELPIVVGPVLVTERRRVFSEARQIDDDHAALFPHHLKTQVLLVHPNVELWRQFSVTIIGRVSTVM